jgi:hypothetical protein
MGQSVLGQFRQQPFHFVLFQRHVDLDGGVAGDGSGDAPRTFSRFSDCSSLANWSSSSCSICSICGASMPAGAILMAMLRAPKGSASNPF